MTRRTILGNTAGGFQVRATRPGFDARTTPFGPEYQIHEDMRPMAAAESGAVTIGAGGNTIFTLSESYGDPPLVLLNDGTGAVMGYAYNAIFYRNTNQLRIYNLTGSTRTIRWAVLADFFA